jgi:hypothetical protein
MKSITIAKAVDGAKLMDEIFAAIPSLRPRDVNGVKTPRIGVSATDTQVTIELPDDADEAAVRAVVAAHQKPAPRKKKGRDALRAEIKNLSNADYKELIAAMAAEYLRGNPGFARSLGIALDGDEPEA